MSKIQQWSFFTFLTVLAYGGGALSFASEGTQRVAVVDMQKALQLVEAGKKARSQLEHEFNAKKVEFQKEEAAIKKMNEDFQKQSLVMNDEARIKKQGELQNRILKFQQATQQSQEEIQVKERSLTQPIVVKMRAIISDLAKKKNYSIVLEKNENFVLHSEDKDDLTSEVVSTFDKGSKV